MIKIKKVFIKSNNIKNKDGIKMMVKIKRYIKMLDFQTKVNNILFLGNLKAIQARKRVDLWIYEMN